MKTLSLADKARRFDQIWDLLWDDETADYREVDSGADFIQDVTLIADAPASTPADDGAPPVYVVEVEYSGGTEDRAVVYGVFSDPAIADDVAAAVAVDHVRDYQHSVWARNHRTGRASTVGAFQHSDWDVDVRVSLMALDRVDRGTLARMQDLAETKARRAAARKAVAS